MKISLKTETYRGFTIKTEYRGLIPQSRIYEGQRLWCIHSSTNFQMPRKQKLQARQIIDRFIAFKILNGIEY